MLMGGDQVYADLVWDTVAPLRNRLAGLDGDWDDAEFTEDIMNGGRRVLLRPIPPRGGHKSNPQRCWHRCQP